MSTSTTIPTAELARLLEVTRAARSVVAAEQQIRRRNEVGAAPTTITLATRRLEAMRYDALDRLSDALIRLDVVAPAADEISADAPDALAEALAAAFPPEGQ